MKSENIKNMAAVKKINFDGGRKTPRSRKYPVLHYMSHKVYMKKGTNCLSPKKVLTT